MALFDRFRRGRLHLNRIEAFSDGVFAIIVTLLVLELHVPPLTDLHSASELAGRLFEQLPKFISWLISFVIVCKFWLNHHHVLNLARHADYAMVWINSLFLLCQSFIPYPTAMLGEYPANPLAVSFFGFVMAINTVMFIALHAYVLGHLTDAAGREQTPDHIIAKSFYGVLSYLLGAGFAWFAPWLAFVVYAATPLLFIVPPAAPESASAGLPP